MMHKELLTHMATHFYIAKAYWMKFLSKWWCKNHWGHQKGYWFNTQWAFFVGLCTIGKTNKADLDFLSPKQSRSRAGT